MGTKYTPDYKTSGGNPSGYISMVDPDGSLPVGYTQYWMAPPKFLGDQSAAYGGSLSYDLTETPNNNPFSEEDVILKGGGMTLVYDTQKNPDTSWTSYRVGLSEAGWKLNSLDGPAATAAQMKAVLSSLTALYIRAESQLGPDTEGLDNVEIDYNAELSPTTTSLTANLPQSGGSYTFTPGTPYTLTATVTPQAPGAGTPAGFVDFSVDGAVTKVPLANGVATLSVTPTGAEEKVDADYEGTEDYLASDSPEIVIDKDQQPTAALATTTSLTTNGTPSGDRSIVQAGGTAVFTANVATSDPSIGVPNGTVTFSINSASGLSQVTSDVVNGVATMSIPISQATSQQFTVSANFNGTATRLPSNSGAPILLQDSLLTTRSQLAQAQQELVQVNALIAKLQPLDQAKRDAYLKNLEGSIPSLNKALAKLYASTLELGKATLEVVGYKAAAYADYLQVKSHAAQLEALAKTMKEERLSTPVGIQRIDQTLQSIDGEAQDEQIAVSTWNQQLQSDSDKADEALQKALPEAASSAASQAAEIVGGLLQQAFSTAKLLSTYAEALDVPAAANFNLSHAEEQQQALQEEINSLQNQINSNNPIATSPVSIDLGTSPRNSTSDPGNSSISGS